MASKKTVRTCIEIQEENVDLLNKWAKETGLPKSKIINMLIQNAAKNKVQLQVTYDLGE